MKRKIVSTCYFIFLLFVKCQTLYAAEAPAYRAETNIVYGTIAGKELTLNAFLPATATSAVPAIVEIHGGWWFGGGKAAKVDHVGG